MILLKQKGGDIMGHMHITAWALALILFVVALVLHNSGKEKASKIVHMSLRLIYLLIIFTGVMMLTNGISSLHTLKIIGGVLVISMLEMILIGQKKQSNTKSLWIILIISLIGTIFLGFYL